MSGDNGLPFPRCKATLYDTGTHVPLAIRWGAAVKPGRIATGFRQPDGSGSDLSDRGWFDAAAGNDRASAATVAQAGAQPARSIRLARTYSPA